MGHRINGEMVRLAREYRRQSQKELASKAGANQATISKIEAGILTEIGDDLASKIVVALDFPIEFFQQNERLTGIGSSAYYHRKRKSLSASDWRGIHGLLNLLRINLRQMLSGVDSHSVQQLVRMEVADYGSATSIAQAVRAQWLLPDGPISDLTVLLENAGIFIIPCHFNTRHLDATSLWLNTMPPMVFVESSLPADRYRFTLAHELGHLVMHEVPTENQEEEADEFASELLMPRLDIQPYFRRKLSIRAFAAMKPFWKVSMKALVYRAKQLRALNDSQYRYYNIELGRMGLPEPYPLEREVPSAWAELVEFYRDELSYTDDEMARMLNLSITEYRNLYGIAGAGKGGPQLRLVR